MDSKRVIEIKGLGKFYVAGVKPFCVIELPNSDKALWGWIIVSQQVLDKLPFNQVGKYNSIYKLDIHGKPISKLLIKDKEMAEDIAFAANRIRID